MVNGQQYIACGSMLGDAVIVADAIGILDTGIYGHRVEAGDYAGVWGGADAVRLNARSEYALDISTNYASAEYISWSTGLPIAKPELVVVESAYDDGALEKLGDEDRYIVLVLDDADLYVQALTHLGLLELIFVG